MKAKPKKDAHRSRPEKLRTLFFCMHSLFKKFSRRSKFIIVPGLKQLWPPFRIKNPGCPAHPSFFKILCNLVAVMIRAYCTIAAQIKTDFSGNDRIIGGCKTKVLIPFRGPWLLSLEWIWMSDVTHILCIDRLLTQGCEVISPVKTRYKWNCIRIVGPDQMN